MEFKLSFIVLVVVLGYAQSSSLTICPNEDLAKVLIGTSWVDVEGQQTTSLVRRTRLPEIGMYDQPLTCVLIIDASIDDSGGNVEITDGGLHHRYIEVRFHSQIGKGLDYMVLAYTENHMAGINSTFTKPKIQ